MLHLAAKAFWPGAGAVPGAARRHRPQLPRGARLPRRAPSSGSALRLEVASRAGLIDDGRLRERPDGTRNPLQTQPLLDAIADAPLRRASSAAAGATRRRPGPRSGSSACATSSASGTPTNQRPELWNLYNAAAPPRRARARLPAVELDRARRLALHRARGHRAARRSTTPTSARCSSATACGWPSARCRSRAAGETVADPPGALPHRRRHVLHRRRRVRRGHPSPRSSPRSPPPRSPSAAPPAPTTGSPRPPWRTARRRATSDGRTLTPARASRTAGSVDDGKSTLVGRLLHDTKSVLADQLDAVERVSRDRGLAAADLALLTDGLRAEREQGITIDVAYRYFATAAALVRPRRLPRATCSTPATRSPAPRPPTLVVLLVDARKGVVEQTRRHLAVAALLRVPHVVLAVNKIDLVDYDEDVFRTRRRRRARDRRRARHPRRRRRPGLGPGRRQRRRPLGANTPWYDGPTLLELLETLPADTDPVHEPFRMPVQFVIRPQGAARSPSTRDYRGYAGQLASGVVRVGDEVVVLPVGLAHHRRRHRPRRALARRRGRAAVGVAAAGRRRRRHPRRPDRRGGRPGAAAPGGHRARLLARRRRRCAPAPGCSSSTASRTVLAVVRSIDGRLDLDALRLAPTDRLALNDIGRVTVRLRRRRCPSSRTRPRAAAAPSCSSTPTTAAPSPPPWRMPWLPESTRSDPSRSGSTSPGAARSWSAAARRSSRACAPSSAPVRSCTWSRRGCARSSRSWPSSGELTWSARDYAGAADLDDAWFVRRRRRATPPPTTRCAPTRSPRGSGASTPSAGRAAARRTCRPPRGSPRPTAPSRVATHSPGDRGPRRRRHAGRRRPARRRRARPAAPHRLAPGHGWVALVGGGPGRRRAAHQPRAASCSRRPTSWSSTGSPRARSSTRLPVHGAGHRRRQGPRPARPGPGPRSTTCSSRRRSPGTPSCGSRAATPTCSGAAARSGWRARRTASGSRSCPA